MTQDMMTLRALLEKSSDADLLREMIGFTAERLMALEVEGLTGAAHGERSPDRITHRNGYRDRSWETRAGTVELKIPRIGRKPRKFRDKFESIQSPAKTFYNNDLSVAVLAVCCEPVSAPIPCLTGKIQGIFADSTLNRRNLAI